MEERSSSALCSDQRSQHRRAVCWISCELSSLFVSACFVCSTGAHTWRPCVTKQGHRQDYCRGTLLLLDRLELQQQRKKKKTLAIG